MATAITAEIGAQVGDVPVEVASEVEVSDNKLCVADSTVVCDVADGTVTESTSGSDTEDECGVETSSESGDGDVMLSDARSLSPPILQGRLIRLTDYLPNDKMPDISFSNPVNFWFSG